MEPALLSGYWVQLERKLKEIMKGPTEPTEFDPDGNAKWRASSIGFSSQGIPDLDGLSSSKALFSGFLL